MALLTTDAEAEGAKCSSCCCSKGKVKEQSSERGKLLDSTRNIPRPLVIDVHDMLLPCLLMSSPIRDGLNDEQADKRLLVALRPGDIDDAGVGTNDDDAELSWSAMTQCELDGTGAVLIKLRRCLFAAGCAESAARVRAMNSLGSRISTSSRVDDVDLVGVGTGRVEVVP